MTWLHGVPHHEIAAQLARSSVAFFPSRWENFPYACLEAMASGCAVVATDCGGFPEMIVGGVSGLLVAPGDQGALERAMEQLAADAGSARALGSRARAETTARFDSAGVSAEALRFYRTLLPGGSRA